MLTNMIYQFITKSGLWLFTLIFVILCKTFNAQEYKLPYIIRDIATCDLDLDSYEDIIVSCRSDEDIDSMYFFYNDGSGNFEIHSIHRPASSFILTGDLDNDSIPDILTRDGENFLFTKNKGNRTYDPEIPIFPTNSYKIGRYIADMDNDGWNDIVYTNSSLYANWGILKNNGSLSFQNVPVYDEGIGAECWPTIGPLNLDDYLDVTVSYPDSGTFACINQGNLSFTMVKIDTLFLGGMPILSMDTVSPSDIMLVRHQYDEKALLENFLIKNTLPLESGEGIADINDYNQDGFDDYIYTRCWWTGCTDSIYVMTNDQDWSFHDKQQYYVDTMWMFYTRSADLNGDSFPDLILTGFHDLTKFKILWNDGFGSFTYLNPVSIPIYPREDHTIKLKASPNPFLESVALTICNYPECFLEKYTVLIRNIYGHVIFYQSLEGLSSSSRFEFMWGGRMQNGEPAPPGMYFIRLECKSIKAEPLKVIKL